MFSLAINVGVLWLIVTSFPQAAFAGGPGPEEHRPKRRGSVNCAGDYPPASAPNGEFVVPASDATKTIGSLCLPDGFVLRFASDVDKVKWTVGTLEYGLGATVDLTKAGGTGTSGGDGTGYDGQVATHGATGAHGQVGGTGGEGKSGVELTMLVKRVVNPGALWVRTDGSSGGVGGRGGGRRRWRRLGLRESRGALCRWREWRKWRKWREGRSRGEHFYRQYCDRAGSRGGEQAVFSGVRAFESPGGG